jgi:hypothetical protein
MPLEVTCQLEAMKHESTVYQFQSILSGQHESEESKENVWSQTEILQLLPPPMPPMSMACDVVAGAMEDVVAGDTSTVE